MRGLGLDSNCQSKQMEIPLITALVSAVSALIVAGVGAGLTYVFTKRREQEIEWRKLKLEHYRAYLTALSGVVSSRSTSENQISYADAVNTLQLVAPETVVAALYNYQDAIRFNNTAASVDSHNAALTDLLKMMRTDVHPSLADKGNLQFRLFDVPLETK